jgi:aminoglycoside phosphotransferase (APT) family kinase protein
VRVPISSLHSLLPAGSVVTAVVPRGGGSRGTVHEVRRAGAEPLVVKEYAAGWRWAQAKEAHVYALLAEHGVGPAPRVVHADLERGVTVLTLVPGRPLSAAGPEVALGAYRRMGELLAAWHRIPMPAFGYLTTEIADPWPDNAAFLRAQFARHLATFAGHGGQPDLHDAIRTRVAASDTLLAACGGAVLCHNDFHEGNVLVDEAGVVTGFVDVENAIAADPLLDLAKTLQYDRERSPGKRAALLAGYGPLPPDADARLELYRLFHSLELWAFFASTGHTGPLASIAGDLRELAG